MARRSGCLPDRRSPPQVLPLNDRKRPWRRAPHGGRPYLLPASTHHAKQIVPDPECPLESVVDGQSPYADARD
jgi:hypothetical protein